MSRRTWGVRPRHEAPADERGAVLVLALLLLLVGTIVVGALSYEVTNDVQASTRFGSVRSLQYAARSATNLAIQSIRYSPELTVSQTLNASPPAPCWGSGAIAQTTSIDGVGSMAAWCTSLWTPTSASTRTVTISTCLASVPVATCAAAPFLQAVVSFDDYPPGVSAPTAQRCVVYCGTTMLLDSWLWSPTAPVVSGVSPPSGPITGGTTVTVTGTGFTQGSTVLFVEESGGTPSSNNVVLPATSATVHSSTSITAVAPAVIEGSTYEVTVTTPTGTSAALPATVFTYTAVPPSVSSVSPQQGSIAGGTSLTLTGSGFVRGAVVRFVQETNGTPVSGGLTVAGSFVDVASSTSLTVVSPGVTSGSTFFVTVTTPSGTSPTSGADVFTFSYLVPTVSAVSPNTGPNAGGTSVTITGTGFITGASVSFVRTASGCSGGAQSASNVTVVNASTITASSPAVFTAGQYYVYVTTTSGSSHFSSSCYPIFTYTG